MARALHDRFQRNVAFCLQLQLDEKADPLADVLAAVRGGGGRAGEIILTDNGAGGSFHEIQLFVSSDEQMGKIRSAVEKLAGVKVQAVLDLAMESHRGGACEVRSRCPITSNTDLRIVYTPGVARVCKAIEAEPAKAREFTNIANRVAIATNGTAILGLGDIGVLAGLPVMEGKAAIFWEFAGISADPVLIETHDADEFIETMVRVAPGYGAIQVEDVKAPECFRITRELDRRLDIPVMHDDQHGTATIVMAGLYSALKKTGKRMQDLRCVMSGAGAAGTAIADMLNLAGVADVVLCDRAGAIYRGRKDNMNEEKDALAARTNKRSAKGSLADVMKGAELFIGVSQPNLVSKDMVRSMAKAPIVLALANPVSEITPAEAYEAGAAVAADGRMMNNALAYPGIFRGALDCGAKMITVEMCVAAAKALAAIVPAGEFLPDMMDPNTHDSVAEAVTKAAGPGTALVHD